MLLKKKRYLKLLLLSVGLSSGDSDKDNCDEENFDEEKMAYKTFYLEIYKKSVKHGAEKFHPKK